jgi:hypothetical protein
MLIGDVSGIEPDIELIEFIGLEIGSPCQVIPAVAAPCAFPPPVPPWPLPPPWANAVVDANIP